MSMSFLVASFIYNVHTSLTAGYFFRASFESMFRSPRSVCTSCLSLAASSSLSLVCRTPEPLPLAILDPAIEGWSELEPSQRRNQQSVGNSKWCAPSHPNAEMSRPIRLVPFRSILHDFIPIPFVLDIGTRHIASLVILSSQRQTDGVQLSSIWEAISW